MSTGPSQQSAPETKAGAFGACNCGAITFRVNQPLTDIFICHCSICRKNTGSGGIAVTLAPKNTFEWLSGTQLIKKWTKPKHEWHTQFCQDCGSPLPGENSPELVYIPVGLLESGADLLTVKHHIWVDSKAHWEEIADCGQEHQQHYQL